MLHSLDDSLLERVLAQLPPSALARCQLVCRHWDLLITSADLWGQGPVHSSGRSPHRLAGGVDSRGVCLHRAASSKWTCGQLAVSATFSGHAGPVTCMAGVSDDIVITGSSDGTARVWDLQLGLQRHVLHMPGAEAVVAVALPSANLAVTATRGGAVLWRAGAAIRRFEALPGGRVTDVALTDTQLLLASSGGTVQHFDLFSGRQQLITRHSSGVTCLRTHRRQQQQHGRQQQQHGEQQQGGMGDEEWLVLVGCMDGQVSCISSSTGRLLWQLPNRHPSKIVSMQLVHLPAGLYDLPPQQQQLQQQRAQQAQRQHKPQRQQQQGLRERQPWMLHVLNARLQLITWHLPRAALEGVPEAQEAAAPSAGRARQHRPPRAGQNSSSSSRGSGGSSRAAVQPQQAAVPAALPTVQGLPLWPLSVCSVATPVPQTSSPPQAPNPEHTGQEEHQDQQQQQEQPHPEGSQQGQGQQPGMRQLLHGAHNTATCMVSPLFGRDCVLIGSSLGYLSVAQLQHQQQQQTGVAKDASRPAAAAAGAVAAHNSAAGSSSRQSDSGEDVPDAEGVVQASAATASTASPPFSASPAAAAVPPVATAAPTADAAGAADAAASCDNCDTAPAQQHKPTSCSTNSSTQTAVALVRHCPLHKLARLLASRHTGQGPSAAGSSSSKAGTRSHAPTTATPAALQLPRSAHSDAAATEAAEPPHNSAALRAQEALLAGCKVQCMAFLPGGRLLVGMGSGHVCMLKLRHPAASVWA